MSEFNNRIDAQRRILAIVNSHGWTEELFGLSSGAINRWVGVNGISSGATLLIALKEAADKLFFLANRSQEQITDEYQLLAHQVEELTLTIRVQIESLEAAFVKSAES